MKNRNSMFRTIRNLNVVAVNNSNKSGFSLYLDFSGQREFLMYHRHNGLIYNLLKDGISVSELSRMTYFSKQSKPGKHSNRNTRRKHDVTLNSVNNILSTVSIYLDEREKPKAS